MKIQMKSSEDSWYKVAAMLFFSLLWMCVLAFPVAWLLNTLVTPEALQFVIGQREVGWSHAMTLLLFVMAVK